MTLDLEGTGRRIIRGEILKILKISFPDGVSNKLLRSTLGRMEFEESRGILRGHCQYLKAKGYLALRDVNMGSVSYICTITPKGIDLLEQTIDSDPGVEI